MVQRFNSELFQPAAISAETRAFNAATNICHSRIYQQQIGALLL
jgi:hypothetical protein